MFNIELFSDAHVMHPADNIHGILAIWAITGFYSKKTTTFAIFFYQTETMFTWELLAVPLDKGKATQVA